MGLGGPCGLTVGSIPSVVLSYVYFSEVLRIITTTVRGLSERAIRSFQCNLWPLVNTGRMAMSKKGNCTCIVFILPTYARWRIVQH